MYAEILIKVWTRVTARMKEKLESKVSSKFSLKQRWCRSFEGMFEEMKT